MDSGYNYALVHLCYTVPPAALLHFLFSPVRNHRDVFKISLLSAIAVITTTPWDSYLIRTNVWSYSPSSVLKTIFSIPVEEYFFFVIQTYITSSLYLLLAKPIVHPIVLSSSIRYHHRHVGVYFFVGLTGVGAWMVICGNQLLYLGLILAWAGPFLTLLTALSESYFRALPLHVTLGSIAVPTAYLCFVDYLALRDGTWIIEKDTKLNWQLWGKLDIEEAAFFLVTNTLIVFGLVACDKAFAIMDAFPEKFPSFRYIPQISAVWRAVSLSPFHYDVQHLNYLRDAFCILENNSRSFYLASMVFPDRCRLYLLSLYAFCRVVDNLIDDASDPEAVQQALWLTQKFLDLAYSSAARKDDLEDIPLQARAAFALLPTLVPFIPATPLQDLLAGFESDLTFLKTTSSNFTFFPIQTEADLVTYCERVASTVAQMFVYTTWRCESLDTSIAKENGEWILTRATKMGVALQLVNIARDIVEDARNGRVYIPVTWFADAGELDTLEALLRNPHDPELNTALSKYALRLVRLAKAYYSDALPGLSHLPRECRKGARLAIEVYMEIGREIERRRGDVRVRVVVDRWTKLRTTLMVLYR